MSLSPTSIYILAALGLPSCVQASLVAVTVVMHELLIVVASLVAERGLQAHRLQ